MHTQNVVQSAEDDFFIEHIRKGAHQVKQPHSVPLYAPGFTPNMRMERHPEGITVQFGLKRDPIILQGPAQKSCKIRIIQVRNGPYYCPTQLSNMLFDHRSKLQEALPVGGAASGQEKLQRSQALLHGRQGWNVGSRHFYHRMAVLILPGALGGLQALIRQARVVAAQAAVGTSPAVVLPS